MSREIKFRAYHKDTNEMFVSSDDIQHLGSWFDAHLPGSLANIENVCIMQFTGLKDKNGVDIYEGDIIDSITLYGEQMIKGTIIFLRGMWLAQEIHPVYKETEYLHELTKGVGRCEVIGNIHQNPSLL